MYVYPLYYGFFCKEIMAISPQIDSIVGHWSCVKCISACRCSRICGVQWCVIHQLGHFSLWRHLSKAVSKIWCYHAVFDCMSKYTSVILWRINYMLWHGWSVCWWVLYFLRFRWSLAGNHPASISWTVELWYPCTLHTRMLWRHRACWPMVISLIQYPLPWNKASMKTTRMTATL